MCASKISCRAARKGALDLAAFEADFWKTVVEKRCARDSFYLAVVFALALSLLTPALPFGVAKELISVIGRSPDLVQEVNQLQPTGFNVSFFTLVFLTLVGKDLMHVLKTTFKAQRIVEASLQSFPAQADSILAIIDRFR